MKKTEKVKIEGNIRVRVAGIVLNNKNELLLVNHVKNGRSYWLLPGGGVEYCEDVHTALKREFMEELSLKITSIGKLVMVHDTIYPDKKRHILNMYFTVKAAGLDKIRVNPDKVLNGAAFVSKADFRKKEFYPAIKDDIISLWEEKFSGTIGYIKVPWTD
jgi:ADP-ribose pyrophosphatase YjhB (NUDIX family)